MFKTVMLCRIKGLVFDVLSEYDDIILDRWTDTRSLQMHPLTELPELEQERQNGFGDRNGGGGFRGGNRFGGGGGGGGGGFAKRKFDRDSSPGYRKKSRFDY